MGLNKTPLGPVTVDVQENLSLGPDANYTIYDYFPLMVSNQDQEMVITGNCA